MRGFHAPPRKSTAPDSRTQAADLQGLRAGLHGAGPGDRDDAQAADTDRVGRRLPSVMIVSSLRNSREASLYGELMGMTRATPGRSSTSRMSMPEVPTAPRIVSSSPDDLADRVAAGGKKLADAGLVLVAEWCVRER